MICPLPPQWNCDHSRSHSLTFIDLFPPPLFNPPTLTKASSPQCHEHTHTYTCRLFHSPSVPAVDTPPVIIQKDTFLFPLYFSPLLPSSVHFSLPLFLSTHPYWPISSACHPQAQLSPSSHILYWSSPTPVPQTPTHSTCVYVDDVEGS